MLIDQETFKILRAAITKEGWVELPAYGNSMYPLIQKGDICRFIFFKPSVVKKGDILLFQTTKGQLIAHRFYSTERINHMLYYITKGDTNLGFDNPILESQVVGRLVSIQKKHIILRQGNVLTALWGKMIQSFPLITGILRSYLNRNDGVST
ncbi:MAG: signal peptidase I [Bacillota bacterium]|nr:signal peptidase I [Bacillota bacterium]